MFQSLKERVKTFVYGDQARINFDFVVDLFNKHWLWKSHSTERANIKGLTPVDISKYLENAGHKHTMVEVFDILKELVARQIIIKSGYDKDQCPIYRALLWD